MIARHELRRYAWLSVGTALVTILLKSIAYWLTGSAGLLSDALESTVNLAAAILAVFVLTVAGRPPDQEHAYGHDKAEYFSSGVEGVLILLAALGSAIAAVRAIILPNELVQVGPALAISLVAAALNAATGTLLLRAGRRYESATLEADAHHLLSDVWTSIGVVIGVAAVAVTGWQLLDPLLALAVAAHILRSGYRLIQVSIDGLMDTALPAEEQATIKAVIARHLAPDMDFHALRTRRAGAQRFMSVHIQVPGTWTVQEGHTFMEAVELDLQSALAPLATLIHLEPAEDPCSWEDISLNRETGGSAQASSVTNVTTSQ
jgi:cation diffusion facilitator family transporter